MKRIYQKIVGAFVLGILVPFVVLHIGGMAWNDEDKETAPKPQNTVSLPTEVGTSPALKQPGYTVFVYMPDGGNFGGNVYGI